MPVIAMKVAKAEAHPDETVTNLRVYQMENGEDSIQVIANLTNVYEVGDIAAVARIGTRMKDGTVIKRTKFRKVETLGMALGKVDAPVGTDLSAQFEADVAVV